MESINILLKINSADDVFDEISLQLTYEEILEAVDNGDDCGDSYNGFRTKIKKLLLEKLKEKIIQDTYDHKTSFKACPSWFKAITGVSIFSQAAYLITNIEAILDDERCLITIDLVNYSIIKGENSFNGPGGFLYDVINFFARVTNFASNFANINDEKALVHKVLLKLLLMMFILMPAALFLYRKLFDACRKTYLDHYFHFNAILSIIYGFSVVGLCVFTGLAFRYFTFKILEKFLTKEEFKDSINISVYSVTKREWIVRIIFGLAIGSIGSILLPYLKPKILAFLNKALGEKHWITRYCDITLSGMIILLGMHVAALRIIIPAFTKVFSKILIYKDGLKKGQPKKIGSSVLVFIWYFGAIAIFGYYAAFEKKKSLGDGTIQQILTQQSILFVAIGFNILGGIFLFKLMMLFVDGRKLCENLLNDDPALVKRGRKTIFTNKAGSITLMLLSLTLMVTMIALFIRGRVKHIEKLSKIVENQWLIATVSTIFVALFFAAMAIFSKTVFIEKILKNGNVKKAISDLVDESCEAGELAAIYNKIIEDKRNKTRILDRQLIKENQETNQETNQEMIFYVNIPNVQSNQNDSIYANVSNVLSNQNDNGNLNSVNSVNNNNPIDKNNFRKNFSRKMTIKEGISIEDVTTTFLFTRDAMNRGGL